MIVMLSLILLMYLAYLGAPFFHYDSEGETLMIQNDKALPFSMLVKNMKSDFPKRKLVNFTIKRSFLFRKELEIYIVSKRVESGVSKLCFDISYLSSKNIKDLSFSLNKIIKENKRHSEITENIEEKIQVGTL